MFKISVPLATHFLAGSILTLVVPLGVLIAVAIWYVRIWRRETANADPR
jgi:hypothetical protein